MDKLQFMPASPIPLPDLKDCVVYHSMDLPGGETINGAWDIRGGFDQYIGDYDVSGKTLLDVGAATGFLTFAAEKAGAKVTSLDIRTAREFTQLPFKDQIYSQDRAMYLNHMEDHLRQLRNGYWYAWHKMNSQAEMVYAPISDLPFWGRKFDVVLAGAIFEHLSDPITALGNLAGLASETVIVAFTDVCDSDELMLKCFDSWKIPAPEHAFTWFYLSRGLYRQAFDNIGFDVEIVPAQASIIIDGKPQSVMRSTIVARRRK